MKVRNIQVCTTNFIIGQWPIGILTPLDFTRYQEYANDNEKDSIEKILEYYI